MGTVLQSFLGQAGIKIETTAGTYRAPTAAQDFIFYTSVKLEDLIEDNVEESYKGQAARDQGFYPGFRHARMTINSPVAQLPTGHFLKAFMGQSTDTGASDPFTHTIIELDAAPPTYTLTVYDATTGSARAVTNAILQRLRLKLASKGLMTMEAVFLGKFDALQSKPTATYDTAPHYIPYEASPTLAGSASTKLLDFEMTCEREVEPVFGFSGVQDLTAVSGNRIWVTGKMMLAPTDTTEIDWYRTNTQPTVSILLTNTASHTLTIQMTKCAITSGSFIEQTTPYVKASLNFRGVNNATDAGPCKFVLLNAANTTAYN